MGAKTVQLLFDKDDVLIRVGDFTRIEDRKTKNEIGRIVAAGGYVEKMTLDEYRKNGPNLYEKRGTNTPLPKSEGEQTPF